MIFLPSHDENCQHLKVVFNLISWYFQNENVWSYIINCVQKVCLVEEQGRTMDVNETDYKILLIWFSYTTLRSTFKKLPLVIFCLVSKYTHNYLKMIPSKFHLLQQKQHIATKADVSSIKPNIKRFANWKAMTSLLSQCFWKVQLFFIKRLLELLCIGFFMITFKCTNKLIHFPQF